MSFAPGPSRPTLRRLDGTAPGVLDRSQPQRILASSGATLSFASFDPFVASGPSSLSRKRALDPDPARPRRIVIETPLRGQSKWRFVPRARYAQGVVDEGSWPRKVNICGEHYHCSEDQWDIYKLDLMYECFVPAPPDIPTIRRKDPSFDHLSINGENGFARKRRAMSPVQEDPQSTFAPNKKFRTVRDERLGVDVEEEITSSDEEDEVEEIMVDDDDDEDTEDEEDTFGSPRKRTDRAAQRHRARVDSAKERRRKQHASSTSNRRAGSAAPQAPPRAKTPEIVDLTMDDNTSQEPSQEPTPERVPRPDITATGNTKRKGAPDPPVFSHPAHLQFLVFNTVDLTEDSSTPDRFKPTKRARTVSPGTIRTELNRKLSSRRSVKPRSAREPSKASQQLWADIFAQAPPPIFPTPPPSQNNDARRDENTQSDSPPQTLEDWEEAQRVATIEESRRKLAELEKDRPLWDQEARKREAQARAEQEALRVRKEAERRLAAEALAREEFERRRAARAAAEAEQRAQAERARIERERQARRQRERERWAYGPAENPAEFEAIPWPVLLSPVMLRVEDIDWAAAVVEKSHKRFHPDRWRARGVLKSVADETERGILEVAATTVSQALTPIWKDTRS
ncbi:uncharacterized protein BXZ73DRAFT_90200 [Epithele typhae]|uniref:uncharacterized protein n=1 Tax=Epithele typhae TaxID=378194 RepID=UPI002008A19D|nr:uncharacterized protein BXZ73DRAFT_90200 [Epithele typhae]KAH9931122.1 hypothetical protein BXZ73DRAFT_90200 [Epithele typhae]